MFHKNEHGFGVLEILIVLVLIAIVVILAINKFGPVKSKEITELCHTNMKAIEWAEKLYYREHQAYTTDISDLKKYIGHIDQIMCPTDQMPYKLTLTEFGFSVREGGNGTHGNISDGIYSWEKTKIHEEPEAVGEESIEEEYEVEVESLPWVLMVVPLVLVILGLLIWSLVWVYQDAEQRGKSGWLVILMVFLLNWPVSLLVWLVFRPERTPAESLRL